MEVDFTGEQNDGDGQNMNNIYSSVESWITIDNKEFFKNYKGEVSSERMVIVGRHFDNQFQVPILFLIGCCVHMILAKTDVLTICFAWFFIFTRLAHSFVHLGRNHVFSRVITYTLGWVAVLGLWLQLAYFSLN